MDEFNLIVYFLRNPNNGLIKIGKTRDFENRYKTLCREEQCELEVLLIVLADDTETQLHSYFSEIRAKKKEWFRDDIRLRELIRMTQESGHLVFPDGAPYRDLPVDLRREVKKKDKNIQTLSDRVSSLSMQINQARYKRDEYKKLSSSAAYYKGLVSRARESKKKLYQIVLKISLISVVLNAIMLVVLSRVDSHWSSRLYLIFQTLASYGASVLFYADYGKRLSWLKILSPGLLGLGVFQTVLILYLYLFE